MSAADFTCCRCGYAMNAMECLMEPGADPRIGDLTLCFNCGVLYRWAPGWKLFSDGEYERLSEQIKSEIEKIQMARRKVVKTDLALDHKFRKVR